MKNTIIIFFLLFFALKIRAQQGEITFGFVGGINRSSLIGSDVDSLSNGGSPKNSNGTVFGMTIDNKMSKYFGLKHELFYSRKNVTLQLSDTGNGAFSSKFKRQYIELFPASATLYYKGIQLYAGPYIGILLNASIQRKDDEGILYTDKSIYGSARALGKYSQKMDFGFVAGINYQLANGFNIGARYIQGFVPVIENTSIAQQWKIYNKNYFVTVGYTFKIK
nr:outer membrane beta-barrel protein [uncultured Chryseobacterium sp.]